MYDRQIVLDVLQSILTSTERISNKMKMVGTPDDFYKSEEQRDALDVLCMQLTAIGEGLKQIDKFTEGQLLPQYPTVDWKGLKGIRDVIAHQYFDISAEAVFDTCRDDIPKLSQAIKTIIINIS